MGSRYEIVIWLLSVTIVTAGLWGINNPQIDIKSEINSYDQNSQKDKPCLKLNDILVYPTYKKSTIISILHRELPETKHPLLKRIEIKDNEVYAILYNDIPCRLGNFDNLNKKLDLVLRILNTVKEDGIKLKGIDVRTLKFPTILEGELDGK